MSFFTRCLGVLPAIAFVLSCTTVRIAPPEPTGRQVQIWRIPPPDVSEARALAMARVLGFRGEITTSDGSVTIIGNEMGPAGPIDLAISRSDIRIGGLSASIGPACGDGIDNDGDGATDLDDPACVSDDDDSEAAAGGQDSADLPVLRARIDTSGSLMIDTLILSQLSGRSLVFGDLEGALAIVRPGTGRLDARTGALVLNLPLRLTATCVGPRCIQVGTCEADLGVVSLRSSAQGGRPFDAGSRRAVVAGTVSVNALASCSSGPAAAANSVFGLPDSTASIALDVALSRDFGPVGPILTMSGVSGAITFARLSEPSASGLFARPNLPDTATAIATAIDFLRAQNMLPPNAGIEVSSDSLTDPSDPSGGSIPVIHRVMFTPRLDVSPEAEVDSLVPVLHARIMIDIGDGGSIIAIDSRWRPAVRDRTVPLRPADDVYAELSGEIPPLGALGAQLIPALRYQDLGPTDPQTFYAPIWAWMDAREVIVGRAATRFSMLVKLVEPRATNGEVDGTAGVRLSATARDGSPPYTFVWRSNIDGALGSGDAITAPLSDGSHTITLTITDSNGFILQGGLPLFVLNGRTPPGSMEMSALRPDQTIQPAFEDGSLPGSPAMDSFTGSDPLWQDDGPAPRTMADTLKEPRRLTDPKVPGIYVDVAPHNATGGRVSPIMRLLGPYTRQKVYARAIYFEQFRYEVTFEIEGVRQTLRSLKCFDRDRLGQEACDFPTSPFSLVSAITAANVTNSTTNADVTFDNLPGTFKLEFDYRPDLASAGGTFPFKAEAWAPYFLNDGFQAGRLGGFKPGVIPEVRWRYSPPAGGIPGRSIFEWCELAADLRDDRGDRLCDVPNIGDIAVEDTFPVTTFKARLYMAVHPVNNRVYGNLVKEAQSFPQGFIALADTDGEATPEQPYKPSTLEGSLQFQTFSQLFPIPAERSAAIARCVERTGAAPRCQSTRADWHNYHGKGARTDSVGRSLSPLVQVPGCQAVFQPEKNGQTPPRDTEPCLHIHDGWFDLAPFSRNQTVNWYILRARRSEDYPISAPPELVGLEALYDGEEDPDPPGIVFPQVLWLESIADSRQCKDTGGPTVDNSRRPCAVFVSPIFLSH
jgi:hypothetical protein